MTQSATLIDDVLTLGSSMLGNLVNARHELKAQAKQHADNVVRKLDLVSREEFDAAFAMLAKARLVQEELRTRVAALEAKTKSSLHATSAKKKNVKVNVSLPLVKKSRRGKR